VTSLDKQYEIVIYGKWKNTLLALRVTLDLTNTLAYYGIRTLQIHKCFVFLVKRVLDLGPDQRESNENVLCLLIIIILISYIITYITIKLLIVENHPSQNWKRNCSSINIEAQNIDF
jgi:hypothetical protein